MLSEFIDNPQYGLAGLFLSGFVVIGKLLLDAHRNALAVRDAQISDLKAEKLRLVARLEMLHDKKR